MKDVEQSPWQKAIATATAKSLQSCPTLCDPIDGSPPGSPVPGILQARTLEWVAIFFSNAWKWKMKVKSFSHVRLLATPWTAAYQAPPFMGFTRQEYWSGVQLPSLWQKARPNSAHLSKSTDWEEAVSKYLGRETGKRWDEAEKLHIDLPNLCICTIVMHCCLCFLWNHCLMG